MLREGVWAPPAKAPAKPNDPTRPSTKTTPSSTPRQRNWNRKEDLSTTFSTLSFPLIKRRQPSLLP